MEQTPKSSIAEVRPSRAERRREWVDRYNQSGLSQRAFAEQHGLCLSTLVYWLKRERDEQKAPAAGTIALHEVTLPGGLGSSPTWVAEVSLPGQRTLRLAAGVPETLLGALLRAIAC